MVPRAVINSYFEPQAAQDLMPAKLEELAKEAELNHALVPEEMKPEETGGVNQGQFLSFLKAEHLDHVEEILGDLNFPKLQGEAAAALESKEAHEGFGEVDQAVVHSIPTALDVFLVSGTRCTVCCTALRCIALQCTVLHRIVLYCTAITPTTHTHTHTYTPMSKNAIHSLCCGVCLFVWLVSPHR